ncbi:MAG: hypothetical protein ACPLKZ_01135 [Candidatus Bathyarchaeales archaeon]
MGKRLSRQRQRAGVTTFLLSIIAISTLSVSYAAQAVNTIYSTGTISYLPRVDVTVNVNQVIGVNNLSLGFMLDHEWNIWLNRPVLKQLARDANFKLVRLFSHRIEPCSYWNEATKTGTFNWANVDTLVQEIFNIGAEPLICIGFCDSTQIIIPPGMAINATTGLPNPESFAAYCAEWVKHFKQTQKLVKYYEILNEPWMYFGWDNYTRISYFMEVFNTAARSMRKENLILLGFEGANRKPVLNYWLSNGGADLDFISFHKYDSGEINYYADSVMLTRAETLQLESSTAYYGIRELKQIYKQYRGKTPIVINSESNFNSACETGTDPKIQQMLGATWVALMLRKAVLSGLDYSVYYSFASSASWERQNKESGGVGFGMVNFDNNSPWYPYYCQWLIGKNLNVGDQIVVSESSSEDIRTLSWVQSGKIVILIISKVDQPRILYLNGISQQQFNIIKIDNTIPWENANIQTGTINSAEPLNLNGYTIALLQSV